MNTMHKKSLNRRFALPVQRSSTALFHIFHNLWIFALWKAVFQGNMGKKRASQSKGSTA